MPGSPHCHARLGTDQACIPLVRDHRRERLWGPETRHPVSTLPDHRARPATSRTRYAPSRGQFHSPQRVVARTG